MHLGSVKADGHLKLMVSEAELRLLFGSVAVARQFISNYDFSHLVGGSKDAAKQVLTRVRSQVIQVGEGQQSVEMVVSQKDWLVITNSVSAATMKVSEDDYHTLLGFTKDEAFVLLRDARTIRSKVVAHESGSAVGLLQSPRHRVYVIFAYDRDQDDADESVVSVEVLPTRLEGEKEVRRLGALPQNSGKRFSVQPAWLYPEGN